MEPVVLSEKQIVAIQSDNKYVGHWIVQSLIKTLMQERFESEDKDMAHKMEVAGLAQQLKWFEETYSTRALGPLRNGKPRGGKCPHCAKFGMSKIGSEYCCFDCGKVWSCVTPAPSVQS